MYLLTAIPFSVSQKKDASSQITMKIDNLHNGDAKFFGENIITSVDNVLKLYSLQGDLIKSYDSVCASWLDVLPNEGIVLYGGGNKQIGIAKIDVFNNFQSISNTIIAENVNLQIDPSIIKVDNTYFITLTEIYGNVNNGDATQENGTYTIHLYRSDDLKNWTFVSDIAHQKNNLEDVEVHFANNVFVVVYEKEELDKGCSSICVVTSKDATGTTWNNEKILLPSNCDHESASFESLSNGNWKLFYSCDKNYPKESYMGGQMFYALYDKDFNLLQKDVEITSSTGKGILLYDVIHINGETRFLFAKNYLTDCDLVVESIR